MRKGNVENLRGQVKEMETKDRRVTMQCQSNLWPRGRKELVVQDAAVVVRWPWA